MPVKRSWRRTVSTPAANDLVPAEASVASVERMPEGASVLGAGKRLGLLGAPLVGLAFVVVLPFAGLVTLFALPLWYGGKALARRVGGMKTWVKNVALFFAAPFLGLAYVVALPFVGMGMLVWMGVTAIMNAPTALSSISGQSGKL